MQIQATASHAAVFSFPYPCDALRQTWILTVLAFLLLPPFALPQSFVNPLLGKQGVSTVSQIGRLTEAVTRCPHCIADRMDLGVALAQSEKWQPALDQFKTIERLAPDNPNAIYNSGLTYLMMASAHADHASTAYFHELDLAERTLTHALQLDPQLPHIHEYLGWLYHLIGDQDSATEQFRMDLEINPKSIESLNNLGTSLGIMQNYGEAVPLYEKALAIDFKCTSCLLNLESAIRRQGAAADALKRYQTMVASHPDSPLAHLLYGMALTISHNQQKTAIDELHLALRAVPELAAAHFYLGELYRQEGDDAKAEAEYRLANQMAPERVEFLSSLATVLLRKNEINDAEVALQRALVLDPENPSIHYLLSRVLQRTGKTLQASRERAETASLERANQTAFQLAMNLNRGIADLRSGKASDAVHDLQVALSFSPNHPETNYYLGIALSQVGDSAGSFQAFQRALERRPESAEIHYNFGIALWGSGRAVPAIEQFQRACAIRPDDGLAHCALGIALLRSGNAEEGQKEISRAQQLGSCAKSPAQ